MMRETQAVLAALLEQHADGFSCLDPVLDESGSVLDLRCTYVNPAAIRLTGRPFEALINHNWLSDLAMPDDPRSRCAGVLNTGQPWVWEPLPLNERLLRATLTRFGDGLGLWLSDITEVEELKSQMQQLAADVAQTKAEANELRELFNVVFESSPVGIAVQDRSFRYVSVNSALLETMGKRADEVIGKTPSELWPTVGSMLESVLQEVVESGEPRLGNELQTMSPDGPKHVLFGSYPVHGAGGIVGIGSFVIDIRARKEAEEFQQQLMGVVSHDLRSPLQAIVIGAQALDRRDRLDAAQQSNIKRIIRSARRMRRLIEDLTDFTRMRVGQSISIAPHPASIDEVCRQVLTEAEASFPTRLLHYRGAGNPRGHWDSGRLVQVLSNLVSNAFKYSPPDVDVELSWWREPPMNQGERGDALILQVKNGGPPIPAEVLPRLFDPFKRGHAQDAMERVSLGLGLYIVKHLVEAHGGTVSARSNEEEGTVFTVRLPSVVEAVAPPPHWREVFSNVVPFRSQP